jgi:hypothetical protein
MGGCLKLFGALCLIGITIFFVAGLLSDSSSSSNSNQSAQSFVDQLNERDNFRKQYFAFVPGDCATCIVFDQNAGYTTQDLVWLKGYLDTWDIKQYTLKIQYSKENGGNLETFTLQ